MDKELQNKLRMVAEYDGTESFTKPYWELYMSDWNMINQVWAKLRKMGAIHGENKIILGYNYYKAVDKDDPAAGFEIICQIIEQINKQP